MAPEGSDWRPLVTGDGSRSLRHPGHGEGLHSEAGAWSQACQRYVAGCRLPERFAAAPGRELAVLDVGTGLGLNLAALCAAAAAAGGRVRVTSLERTPEPIRRGVALREAWEREVAERGAEAAALEPEAARLARRWLRPVHAALALAIGGEGAPETSPAIPSPRPPRGMTRADDAGCGLSPEKNPPAPWLPLAGLGALRLVLGDARETLPRLPEAQRFDAVFLDPFSPAVEPELWSRPFLAAVARRMAPGSWLATYSAATEVRAALAAAGLRVGSGGRVGAKADGTLASPDLEPPPLPPRVARRIERRAREGAAELGSAGPGCR